MCLFKGSISLQKLQHAHMCCLCTERELLHMRGSSSEQFRNCGLTAYHHRHYAHRFRRNYFKIFDPQRKNIRKFYSTSRQSHQSENEKLSATKRFCETTGKRSLEDAISIGDKWDKDFVYNFEGIPAPREHNDRQQNPRGLPIHRPPSMYKTNAGFDKDYQIHDRYLELYRNALNTSGEDLKNSTTGYTSDSLNLNIGFF